MGLEIEMLVDAAREGNEKTLEALILKIQDKIYGLALRMLFNPLDAEDATQEILLKIITHLGTFKGESSFTTWMYKVAANHLLTLRKRRAELEALSFDDYQEMLDMKSAGGWEEAKSDVLQHLFVDEIRMTCLQGLLLCLDREHRLAFIMAEIFDISTEEGAFILEITPAAFRKRVSRSRQRIQHFLNRNCTLINPDNPCKCEGHVTSFLAAKKLDKDQLVFSNHPCRFKQEESTLNHLKELDELSRMVFLYKHYPDFHSPNTFLEHIRDLLRSKKYELLM
jgi:RNA polymerase sigma factor (sigma-70 family)